MLTNVRSLPQGLKARARKLIEEELTVECTCEWAIDYHRKLVMMINEDKERGEFYSEHDGELCISLQMGMQLETEKVLRALIKALRDEQKDNP